VNRAILLQTEATESKKDALKSFLNAALSERNRILPEREGCKTFMSFHRKVWDSLKPVGFNSQVRCDLERLAWRKKAGEVDGITLNRVDAYHTSKLCSYCGAVGSGHAKNYSLFKCKKCGQVVNSDRKASLAVAVKSLLERSSNSDQNWFQISGRRVPVSGLVRVSDAAGPKAVPIEVRSRGKPTGLSRG
jgi:hypothetical protein